STMGLASTRQKRRFQKRKLRRAFHETLEPRRLMAYSSVSHTGNPIHFPTQMSQIREAPGANGGDPSPAAIDINGVVQFGTGIVQLAATPALASSVGVRFGQSLLFSNQDAAAGRSGIGAFGYGMTVAQIPQLIFDSGGMHTVRDGSVTDTFDSSGTAAN